MAATGQSLVEWLTPDALYRPQRSLKRLVKEGHLSVLDPAVVKYNMQHHEVERFGGGEAEVYLLNWHLPPGGAADSSSFVACPISPGRRVALKVRRLPDGSGGYLEVANEADWQFDATNNRKFLRNEVNVLKLLELSGLADRVPQVLGIVQHEGDVNDPPLFGYVMPCYRLGSLASLIRNVCDRRVPESVFANFFSLPQATGEFRELMQAIARCGEIGIVMQDISSNNLLIREEKGETCRLLLADPSITMRACDLAKPDMSDCIASTWLWGSSTCRYKRFDPTADTYSMSFSFLELWLCAEGATVPLFQLVEMTGLEANRDQARAFSRNLCVQVLRRHMLCPGAIVPRIKRELPVSWLMLWLLLLGTEDFASEQQLLNGHQHRRPAEADMVDAATQLAAVAADVEALDGGLTAESLAKPAGEALVARCLRLYERLTSLSQLDPPQGSPLVPLDGSLSWVATYFMAQDHPLVAAMRAAQGPGAACPPTPGQVSYKDRFFNHAVLEAQDSANCSPYLVAASWKNYQACLGTFVQEYVRRRDEAVALLLSPLPQDLHSRLESFLSLASASSPAAGATGSGAAGQPASYAAAAAGQQAPQPLYPAGPPPARPPAAGPASMPQWPPAHSLLSPAAPRAASMPAFPSVSQRHAAAGPLLGGSAGLNRASMQTLLGTAAALTGPISAGMPAQLAVAAGMAGPSALGGGSQQGIMPSLPAGAAAHPLTAGCLPQPLLTSLAARSLAAAPSSSLIPGFSTVAAAAPRSPAAFPPPSFLQQPAGLTAAAGDAASPSAGLSSRTVAGGPGDASPATSGVSSPNKRKRVGLQPAPVVPGTILRFAPSRDGCIAGLPALRLPPSTSGSNMYAYVVAQLSERFRGDVHHLLAQKQGPFTALLAASGLQPAQLDSVVQRTAHGRYIEVSAASFLPDANATDYTSAAPIIFHSSSRGTGGSEQQIECGGGSAEEQAQYSAALAAHLQQSVDNGLTLAWGSRDTISVHFRIATAHLPQGSAAMPWVPHDWGVPAADLAAIADRGRHLFRIGRR